MIAREPSQSASPVAPPSLPKASILIHWLILISGLALLTVLRIDEVEKVVPLWFGSVLGTAAGQLLAHRRMRMWLFAFIVGNMLWIGPLTLAPMWPLFGMQPWASVDGFVMAFAPAAFCGYFSLSERGALVAFWFPAVPWMVAILDRGRGATLEGEQSYVLLSALAVLLLGALRARETRRVAIWREYATFPLAVVEREAVLRQAPLRRAGQLAWMAIIGFATLAMTAWIAPSLFQTDNVTHRLGDSTEDDLAGVGSAPTWTCCADASQHEIERKRIKEYLPTRRLHDGKALDEPGGSACIACSNGLPLDYGRSPGVKPPVDSAPVATVAPLAAPTQGDAATSAAPAPDSAPVKPTSSAAPVANKTPAKAPLPKRPAPRRSGGAKLPSAGTAVNLAPGGMGIDPFAWAFALAISATLVQLATRPVRRFFVLRHLQRPFWPETVDQRVSNLWQWMLVGLRDAGFHAAPGEQPHELARRVGLEGMKICATVLERARHGVRVDGADLEAMESAARAVYAAARADIGWAARAASWLRWPLA